MEGKTKANLSDILQFIIGLRKVPPLGFDRKITLQYTQKQLPEASTCFYLLHVPIGLDCKETFLIMLSYIH